MREKNLAQVTEREQLLEIMFLSLGLTTSISAHSIFEEVVGFSPLLFPRGKSLCLLSIVIDLCACYSLR